MEENQFNLGEALGSYEQAKADRDFYLSMVQGGTQMASPIASYLAGVAGVKMATQREKIQNVEDKRQAENDALAATERLQKRQATIEGQIINIMKGTRDGSLAPGAAAAMLGPLTKELGYNLKKYDADNHQLIYEIPGYADDYVFDLKEAPTTKEKGIQGRAEAKINWEREKQQKGFEGQKDVASYKAGLKQGKQQEFITLSEFKGINKDVIDNLSKEFKLQSLPLDMLNNYISSADQLSNEDFKAVEDNVTMIEKELRRRQKEITKEAQEKGIIPENILKKSKHHQSVVSNKTQETKAF